MEINFTPWRLDYIKSDKKEEGCIFCKALEGAPSFDNLVVLRAPNSALILNRFPYNNGHLLAVPKSHIDSLCNLSSKESKELTKLLSYAEKAIRVIYQPNGINIGMNLGEAAGAGITDHIHYHILPRWRGDTNFVTIMGNLRVIPESLQDTYKKFKEFFEKDAPSF